MEDIHEVSLDRLADRARMRMNDDRKEYAKRKKEGRKFKDFVNDDREEYKKKMKYGKHYND